MRKLHSIADETRDLATYDLGNDRYIQFSGKAIREFGLGEMLRRYGVEDQLQSGERVTVFQRDEAVGTVPGDFDPMFIKSRNFLHDPRPGDFIRTERGWDAARNLGPGDLETIPGFIRSAKDSE